MIAPPPLYDDPSAVSPLKPIPLPAALRDQAVNIVGAAGRLANSVHPLTARAVATFLRPANSYYSNLIEGHDTHPLEIARALLQDYAHDKRRRSLQEEAVAHIAVHERLPDLLRAGNKNPYTEAFWRSLHREFYQHLPTEFRWVELLDESRAEVMPGELRTQEVMVGRHLAPAATALPDFLRKLEDGYAPRYEHDPLARVVAIAAAHHRLAWAHPFLDGNGRVMRLFSDAAFMAEGLDAGGLWSMSRALSRHEKEYKLALAAADAQRQGDHDGRGNLSAKSLVEFCDFFLRVAFDQIEYMTRALAIDKMLDHLGRLVDLLVLKQGWRPEAFAVLESVFLKGSIPRGGIIKLTRLSDKTAKGLAQTLLDVGLLATDGNNRFAPYRAAYPIGLAPVLFPGLYPSGKESDMLKELSGS